MIMSVFKMNLVPTKNKHYDKLWDLTSPKGSGIKFWQREEDLEDFGYEIGEAKTFDIVYRSHQFKGRSVELEDVGVYQDKKSPDGFLPDISIQGQATITRVSRAKFEIHLPDDWEA
jgi:hypothetical protein